MSLESLKLLESKIGAFVDQHERVRQEHESLAQRVKEREKQLADAAAQLKQYEKERDKQLAEAAAQLKHSEKERDKQLADAAAQLKQYEQERTEIRTRLERILSRLEGLDLT